MDVLSDAAAREIADAARQDTEVRGRFLVAFAGGRTPVSTYQRLANAPLREAIDWTRVEAFTSDERAVPPEHPESNFAMLRRTLLDPVGIPPERAHRMRGEAEDLDAAAREYEQALLRIAGEPPVLDLVILGIGADGHTASLFPGASALSEASRWVVASTGPEGTGRRLTLTFPTILAARRIMVLVAGADKTETLRRVMAQGDEAPLPAERLHEAGSRVVWIVEEQAARLAFGDADRTDSRDSG
jgi:6-phosphogluconolactonase